MEHLSFSSIEFATFQVNLASLQKTLSANEISFSVRYSISEKKTTIFLLERKINLYLGNRHNKVFLGVLNPKKFEDIRSYSHKHEKTEIFSLILSFSDLSQIEKYRGGKDLHLFIEYTCQGLEENSVSSSYAEECITIPQSLWIQELNKTTYDTKHLIETFSNSRNNPNNEGYYRKLDEGWKLFLQGNYSSSISTVRHCLEILKTNYPNIFIDNDSIKIIVQKKTTDRTKKERFQLIWNGVCTVANLSAHQSQESWTRSDAQMFFSFLENALDWLYDNP